MRQREHTHLKLTTLLYRNDTHFPNLYILYLYVLRQGEHTHLTTLVYRNDTHFPH